MQEYTSAQNITTLYLVRHGETDYNRRCIVQGRGINCELNETGRMQAGALAERLRGVPFDAIYSSTLKRAQETAAAVAQVQPGVVTHYVRDLEEMSWGIYEGAEMSPDVVAAFKHLQQRWAQQDFAFRVQGGESILDVQQRALRVMRDLLARHQGETLLVVTHGRFLRVLLASILDGYSLGRMQEIRHSNTAVNLVCWDGSRFDPRLLNCTLHLAEDVSVLVE